MSSIRSCGLVMSVMGMSLFAVGCVSGGYQASQEAGAPRIRRPVWYNYYERGLIYAGRKEWQLAARDFGIAAGEEPGIDFPRPEESRRAKTYGLHFISDYHPHRERGICLFRLGRLEEAREALRRSLQMLPTDRAREFLGRTDEAISDRSG